MTGPESVPPESMRQLVRVGTLAADGAWFRAAPDATGAEKVRLAVEAALLCAIGNRMVVVTDPASWPDGIVLDPPYDPAHWPESPR